eukprot:gene31231-6380_t
MAIKMTTRVSKMQTTCIRPTAPVRVSRVVRAQAANNGVSAPVTTPYDNYKFAPIREATVSRAMTSRYMKDLDEYADTDQDLHH